jgi:hypothetical protein
MRTTWWRTGVALLIVGMLTSIVAAQAAVTAADISRLETSADEIGKVAEGLRKSDPTLAKEVDQSLADLRDEVSYLKVKLRREGTVTRQEYASLRDRLETLRTRAQGQKVTAQPVLPDAGKIQGKIRVVPVGTELDVRLQTPLSSATAKIEQRFEATTLVDYVMGEEVAIPAGSSARGFVSSVRPAGRIDRKGSLTISFDELRIEGRSYRMRALVLQTLDPKVGQDAARIGAGAVVGGILGGVFGGGKGALIGVLVGGGGTIAATEGSDVELPVGTVLRIRLDQPLEISTIR